MRIFQFFLFVLIFAVVWNNGVNAEDTFERVKNGGTVRLGIANAPPWCELTPDGKITGAAPDITIATLKQLGIDKVEAKVVEYGAMIPGLNANRFDIVAAGLFMKPARCAQVLYSEPDVCDAQAFAVKKGNPFGVKSYKDIAKNPKIRVGVCGGCVEEGYARDAGVPGDRIVTIPDEQSAIKMLQDGRIDVYGYPTLSISALLKKTNDQDIEMVSPVEGTPIGCAGAAFRKSDRAFRDAYDEALKKIKASGEFDLILEKYGMPVKAAKMVTREELCGGDN